MRQWLKIVLLSCLAGGFLGSKPQGKALKAPLAGSICPTSSFGSWRPGHLHAGLDLSTFGRTGIPVVAVDSCWLWRIRIWNGGYGKALYLRLPNGMVAVYGHLSRFIPEIEATVEAEQDSLCKHEIELYFEPWRFRFAPGDTVAYSGDTGSGPPHLHFELRSDVSSRLRINPLDGYLDLRESHRPRIASILLEPLGPTSSINGNYKPIEFDMEGICDTVRISGGFGLAVDAYDTTLCERLVGIDSYRVEIDGNPIWSFNLDFFPSPKAHFVDAIYEVFAGKRFVRLYAEPGLDLEGFACYSQTISSDFDLLPGHHRLVIRALDAWGNADSAEIDLQCGMSPVILAYRLARDTLGTAAVIQARYATSIRLGFAQGLDQSMASGSGPKKAWQWLDKDLAREGLQRVVLPVSSPAEVACRITGIGGISCEGVLSTLPRSSDDMCKVDFEAHQSWIEATASCDVAPLSLPVMVWSHCDTAVNTLLQPIGRGRFRGIIPLSSCDTLLQPSVEFDYTDGSIKVSETLRILAVLPGGTTWFSDDGILLALHSSEANPLRFFKVSSDSSEPYRGFAGRGLLIEFEPRNVFFPDRLGIDLNLRLPVSNSGVFALRGSRPAFLACLDEQGSCHLTLTTLVPVAILKDVEPPSIRWKGGIEVRDSDRRVFIKAIARDEGSGIDAGSIKASIDNECAVVSYDPDNGTVEIRSRKRLRYGDHRIRLEARDRVGNLSAIERLIHIGR